MHAFMNVHVERQIHLACTLSQYQNRIKSVLGTKESLSCERRTGITRDFCLAVVFTFGLFGLYHQQILELFVINRPLNHL